MTKKIFAKLLSIIPALALALAVGSAASPCFFFYHQPDVPEALKKYE